MSDIPWWGWIIISIVLVYSIILSLALGFVIRFLGRLVDGVLGGWK